MQLTEEMIKHGLSYDRNRWVAPSPEQPKGRISILGRLFRGRKQTVADDRIGHRERFPHEVTAATDFEHLQKTWISETGLLKKAWKRIRETQIEELTKQATEAFVTGNQEELGKLEAPPAGADVLTNYMVSIAKDAIKGVEEEATAQGATFTPIDIAALEPALEKQAAAVAQVMARDASAAASRHVVQKYGTMTDVSAEEVAQSLKDYFAGLSDTYLDDQLGGALTAAQNFARMSAMDGIAGVYYASELLDQNTCEKCKAIDGKEFYTVSDASSAYPTGGYKDCLGGPRCRGTIVAVFDEAPSGVAAVGYDSRSSRDRGH